jgi:2-haloacid dehalogenase
MGRANKMSGIHACVFDAYGTLFDYASAAAKCEDRLGRQARALHNAVARQAVAI